MLSPSALNVPVDVLLSTVVPIHAWFGMNNVIGDYVSSLSFMRSAPVAETVL